jgi:dihydrodipicolinate synthase/N-acetylneuraminate lyase
MNYQGLWPALTTPFDEGLGVDHGQLAEHARWLVASGATGVVACGSLGEAATLGHAEKRQVLETLVRALEGRAPVVAGVAALATAEAVALARDARTIGCAGLMVLPPYVYSSDWREMKAHVTAVIEATDLPCLLYNNPVAYRTDFSPEQIVELARALPQLAAVKESSADVRRVAAIRALAGDRLAVLVGVDDVIVEGIAAGAVGWVAGLVNAFPAESLALYRLAVLGRIQEAHALYRWFLPLLRMDTVTKFVQLIKLTQERVGRGSARVRPPRLGLAGEELEVALATIDTGLATRPQLPS